MAYDKTFTQIITETARRLSQVSGASVQLYSEDRLADIIRFVFDQLFDKYIWPQYSFTNQYTLDGATGVVTADISSVLKDYSHIEDVFIASTNTRLPFLPSNINPYTLTGTTPQYIERVATASKVFRVWPLASTGVVTVKGQTKPTEFVTTDTVVFDHHALVLGAVSDYLVSDGTNLEDAQKFNQLFASRVKEIAKQLSGDVPLSTTGSAIPTEWF